MDPALRLAYDFYEYRGVTLLRRSMALGNRWDREDDSTGSDGGQPGGMNGISLYRRITLLLIGTSGVGIDDNDDDNGAGGE